MVIGFLNAMRAFKPLDTYTWYANVEIQGKGIMSALRFNEQHENAFISSGSGLETIYYVLG